MKECSKSIQRRLHQPGFLQKYFKGSGLDIGGKPDPLSLYLDLFPLMTSVRTWDIEDGDAQFLRSLDSESFDFVHSSHCLEHLNDPIEGLKNWFRVVRPGGFLIITVPDEDLYEQGVFPPSSFNSDHKWSFTVFKHKSWSLNSINLIDLIKSLPNARTHSIKLLDSSYRYNLPRFDQTLSPVGESGIELIIQKYTEFEVAQFGRIDQPLSLDDEEARRHLNQYKNDLNFLKSNNKGNPPFTDASAL